MALTPEYNRPPSMRQNVLIGLGLILALTMRETSAGDLGIAGDYAALIFGILEVISISIYVYRSIQYERRETNITDRQVQLAKAHVSLAIQIPKMSAMQMNHHIAIINALQFPTKFDPNGIIQLLDGREVKVSSLLKYIDGMQLEKPEGEGEEAVFKMKAERDADPEDRTAMRTMADELVRHNFAIKDHKGNKSVLATETGLLSYVSAICQKNELAAT